MAFGSLVRCELQVSVREGATLPPAVRFSLSSTNDCLLAHRPASGTSTRPPVNGWMGVAAFTWRKREDRAPVGAPPGSDLAQSTRWSDDDDAPGHRVARSDSGSTAEVVRSDGAACGLHSRSFHGETPGGTR